MYPALTCIQVLHDLEEPFGDLLGTKVVQQEPAYPQQRSRKLHRIDQRVCRLLKAIVPEGKTPVADRRAHWQRTLAAAPWEKHPAGLSQVEQGQALRSPPVTDDAQSSHVEPVAKNNEGKAVG